MLASFRFRTKTKKNQKYNCKRFYDCLIQCELVDGGQLLQAAKLKKDDMILNHIENRLRCNRGQAPRKLSQRVYKISFKGGAQRGKARSTLCPVF